MTRPPIVECAYYSVFGPLAGSLAQFDNPQALVYPTEPQDHAGVAGAVPLWSGRSLTGVLLYG